MSVPSETTATRAEVRQLLAQTRRNKARTDTVVSNAQATLDALRAINPDHLADRLREIIRGAA